jgi:hypothetical protein
MLFPRSQLAPAALDLLGIADASLRGIFSLVRRGGSGHGVGRVSPVVTARRRLVPAPYYDELRARGKSHNTALRQLGNRLVGILQGCLKTGTCYDEQTVWGHRHGTPHLAAACHLLYPPAPPPAAAQVTLERSQGQGRPQAARRVALTLASTGTQWPAGERGHGLTLEPMGCLDGFREAQTMASVGMGTVLTGPRLWIFTVSRRRAVGRRGSSAGRGRWA